MFGQRERVLDELIVKFFGEVKLALPELGRMISDYLSGDKHFKEDAFQVHVHEHAADEIRREILTKLCQGALLPFYREDTIVLVYMGDEIANLAEQTASFLVLTRPRVPAFLEIALREMVAATSDAYGSLETLVATYREDEKQVSSLIQAVEEGERKVDRLQWEMVKSIFKSDLPLAEKLHLKELVDGIAAISDQIQDVGERLQIMLAKRPI